MDYNNWQSKKILDSKEHQDKIYRLLNNQNFIKRVNKTITLDDNKEYTEFISCSYLGLDQDPRVINGVSNNMSQTGVIFASSRTRMKYKELDTLEDILNQIFSANTVIFSTTHLTHLGLIPLIASGEMPSVQIAKNGCTFLLDQTVHASIQINRGLMQQFGNVEIVDFYNLTLLEQKLESIKSQSKTPLLFSDSVCSMGGMLPLEDILNLAKKYIGYLYLDDAHGMSIYGKNGAGYVIDKFNQLPSRLILATSLAKGFGVCGGVAVLPTSKDVEFVKTYCSTYMFSGTLINPLINACIESGKIHLSSDIIELQERLFKKTQLFDNLIKDKAKIINFGYRTPIRGILVGDEANAIENGLFLKEKGFLTVVATYPIRKKGQSILRVLICATHTDMEIERLCKVINLIL